MEDSIAACGLPVTGVRRLRSLPEEVLCGDASASSRGRLPF